MVSSKKAALAAVAIAASVAVTVPASAGQLAPTKVTIRYDGFHAPHGKVYSPRAPCRQHRKVWLRGVHSDGSSSRLDFTFTNKRGKWSVETQFQGATGLRAKAPRKLATGVICEPDRSPTVPTGL
jgi:hypothetical protein